MSDTAPTMRDVIERTASDLDAKASAAEAKESRSESRDVPRETKADKADKSVPAVTTDDDDPLKDWNEAPAWAKRWNKDAAKALRGYATDPNNGEAWKHIGNELNGLYTSFGKQANEVGQLRQFQSRYAPIHDQLSQWEQRWAMQGQSLQQGLGQMFAVTDSLARDPDNTLAWLASMYRPKDAGKFLQTLAQATGADLTKVVNEQPYIDPAVTQMVNPLLQRLQQLEGTLATSQQNATQHMQQQVLGHIQAFENAVDEHGQPKHPYLRDPDFFSLMLTAMNHGHTPRDLSAAYAWAEARHPAAIQAKAKAAEAVALREAARTTENSNQAKQASNNLNGTAARGRNPNPKPSMRDAIRQTARKMGENIPESW